jgi:Fe-S-cluster-containing hydrogenase component 2
VEKVLVIDFEKCTGCRNCELACSVAHTQSFNPARSRIQILKNELENMVAPMVCLQCENPLCEKACPNSAIVRNKHGILYVDSNICIGCMNCVTACIYGGITIDSKTKKAIKCNQCEAKPKCIDACEYGAISFVDKKEGLALRKSGTRSITNQLGIVKEGA